MRQALQLQVQPFRSNSLEAKKSSAELGKKVEKEKTLNTAGTVS